MSAGGMVYGDGSGDSVPVRVEPGELAIRPNGEVIRFTPCDGGFRWEPTGSRVDMKAAARQLKRLNDAR